MSSYRQQYLDSSRRRKSNIPLPNQKLKLDLSQMSDISNDTDNNQQSTMNLEGTNLEGTTKMNFQSGDSLQKSPSKSRIPVPSPSVAHNKPPIDHLKKFNAEHKAAVSELESKLRLREAETTRLDTELENAKTLLSNKIKEIRESAKIVKEVDSIREKNTQLTSLTEELKATNSDLNLKLANETKLKKQIELRNTRLETLLKTKPSKLANSNKNAKCSIVKSVLYAVEHALVLSCISYAVYYKYLIEPEQERAAKSWWR